MLGPSHHYSTDSTLEHNKNLKKEIRAVASGQILAGLAYQLTDCDTGSMPKEVCILTEEGQYEMYQPFSLNLTPELFGYYLLPVDKNCGDIKVIFKGTRCEAGLAGMRSWLINLESWGPAMSSFPQDEDILFNTLQSAIAQHYPAGRSLTLQVCGHSQGGAISQLFINALLRRRLYTPEFQSIKDITMTVLNSPGVTDGICESAIQYLLGQNKTRHPLNSITMNYGMVGGDLVQTTGLNMLFADFPAEWVEVNVLKVDRGLEGYWRKDLDWKEWPWEEFTQVFKNFTLALMNAHPNKNFFGPHETSDGKVEVDAPYHFYTNRNSDDIPDLLRELRFKAPRAMMVPLYVIRDMINNLDFVYKTLEFFIRITGGWSFRFSDVGVAIYNWFTSGRTATQEKICEYLPEDSRYFPDQTKWAYNRYCASSDERKSESDKPDPGPSSSSSPIRNRR